MNITIVRERLVEVLQKASYFTSSKITDLKIFKAVLLTANQNIIKINTTNVNEFFSGEIGGKVLKTGTVLVDLKTLIETVKNLTDSKITLSKQDKQLKINGESGEVKLVCLDENNFPNLEKPTKTIKIKNALFVTSVIQPVLLSCATDEARPILTGVCFDFKEKATMVVGTDGFRLTLQKLLLTIPELVGNRIVLSGKSLLSVLKVFKDELPSVFLSGDYGQVFFESGEVSVSSRVLEGEYPPYEKVIPQGFETSATVKSKELLEMVRASSLFAKEGSGMLNLAINNKELLISSAGVGVGEAQFRTQVAGFSGKENRIVFNYRYLLEYLSAPGDEEVVFEMSTAFAPGVFKGKKNPNLVHIIMPIRSQE